MAISPEIRTRVEAELLSGKQPRELSEGAYYEKYGVAYVTILNWQKKLQVDDVTETISDLTKETTGTLEVIRDAAKSKAPKVAKDIDNIIDGVAGLKLLEPKMQKALTQAVNKAYEYLLEDDLSVKDWQTVTSTLAQTYAAVFNSKGTTVNVAQNNINTAQENLGFFKSSQKKL